MRLTNNEYRNIWRGDTVRERLASMAKSYTQDTISKTDIAVILSNSTNPERCYVDDNGKEHCRETYDGSMFVAQISDCGWLDFFKGQVSERRENEFSDHMSLMPSQVEILFAAYQAWKVTQETKEISRIPWSQRADMILTPRHNAMRADYV
jgi:hypothetical protein